jgi:hypothetical protein
MPTSPLVPIFSLKRRHAPKCVPPARWAYAEDANIAKTKYWPDGEEADRGIGCLLAKHRRHFPQNREPAPYFPPTVDPHTNREHDDLARNLRAHPLSQNLVHDPSPLLVDNWIGCRLHE